MIIEPEKYWASTGNDVLNWIQPLFNDETQFKLHSKLIQCLVDLSQNKIITASASFFQNKKPTIVDFNIGNFEDIIAYMLFSQGYMTYSGSDFRIPNKEILSEFAPRVFPQYCSKIIGHDTPTKICS